MGLLVYVYYILNGLSISIYLDMLYRIPELLLKFAYLWKTQIMI